MPPYKLRCLPSGIAAKYVNLENATETFAQNAQKSMVDGNAAIHKVADGVRQVADNLGKISALYVSRLA